MKAGTEARHALEWIRENPRRLYNRIELGDALGRVHLQCVWCGKQVKPPRARWCNDQCVNEFRSYCDPAYQRYLVRLRDKEICTGCGCHAGMIERIMDHAWRDKRPWQRGEADMPPAVELYVSLGFNRTGSTWEAEHVIPIAEGGGGCGPDGLTTLCIPCHKQSTRALAARRRRGSK
jgi:5-methylcytosine-specific restriction enzyme A